MTLPVSPRWLEQIKQFEGFRAKAYKDTGGVWTIGYGHTKGVKSSDVTTKELASAVLIAELEGYAGHVEALCNGVDLTEGQRDALIDFAYNAGVTALSKSTLLKCVLRGDMKGASDQFSRWVYDNGRKLPGLVERRARERERFLSAVSGPLEATVGAAHQDTVASPAVAQPRPLPPEPGVHQSPPATLPGAAPNPSPVFSRQPDEPPPEPAEPEPWWRTLLGSKRVKAGATLAAGSQVPGWIDSAWATFEDWCKTEPDALNVLWSHAATFLTLKFIGYAIFAAGGAWLIWTLYFDRRTKG